MAFRSGRRGRHTTPGSRRRRAARALRAAGAGVVVVLGIVATPGVAAARPVSPSDGQIRSAQQAASDAANDVRDIGAQLAGAQAAVDTAQGEANIALDRYEGQQQQYETAQGAAAAADTAERGAQQELDAARIQVASFARDSYISGSTSSRMQGLLTSGSPTQMLERAALLDAAGDRRSAVLDRMSAAQARATAAAAVARAALDRARTLKEAAAATLAAAERAEVSARSQAAALQSEQTQLQGRLDAARQTLATLQGQRAAALAFAQQPSGSLSGGMRLAGYTTAGPPSASAVATAVAAAERWLGTRYAWGGGSLTGPSVGWGIDAGVTGFDCSGLTRYAYAQAGIVIPRQSTQQYAALPKVSSADLQPGDLVFYAFDTGDPATIHHVTMYLGGSRMIEAPESGELVRITAMRWSGFIGAARPSA